MLCFRQIKKHPHRIFHQRLGLQGNVPSSSRTTGDEEASTKPRGIGRVAYVEAARILGGQLFVPPANQSLRAIAKSAQPGVAVLPKPRPASFSFTSYTSFISSTSFRYFARSRCTTLEEYLCFCSVLRTASASITERCRPPVQPNAMVR
jgi:hypothetical protein